MKEIDGAIRTLTEQITQADWDSYNFTFKCKQIDTLKRLLETKLL